MMDGTPTDVGHHRARGEGHRAERVCVSLLTQGDFEHHRYIRFYARQSLNTTS